MAEQYLGFCRQERRDGLPYEDAERESDQYDDGLCILWGLYTGCVCSLGRSLSQAKLGA